MPIVVKLDDMLHDRRMTTLDAICEALSCQPGDSLRFEAAHAERQPPRVAKKQKAS